MKRIIIYMIVVCFSFTDQIPKSLVKIYSSHQQINYLTPWQSGMDYSSTATGFIIDGNQIITNAHAVLNSRFLQVRKEGESKKYLANVKYISEEYDLAILEIEDKNFFKNTTSLKFGSLSQIKDKVTIYGYPVGGDKLSRTEGIVSRLEHNSYTLTDQRFLIGQTDAAINPGNSGGPIINNNKVVGVAFAGLVFANNIGYFIPVNVVEHFLDDVKDGAYNGSPKLGVVWQKLENPAYRKMLGLEQNSNGVLIKNILKNSPVENVFQEEDVLLKLDNYAIDFDGTILFRKDERTDFQYINQQKKFGEKISYQIVRDKKLISGSFNLEKTKIPQKLVKEVPYSDEIPYFIYGGFLFEPLTANFVKTSTSLQNKNISGDSNVKDFKELVVLVRVLPDDVNIGYTEIMDTVITNINNEKYENFKDFVKKIKLSNSEFIEFKTLDGTDIVLDRKEILSKNQMILDNYNIPSDVSNELKKEIKSVDIKDGDY